MQTNSLLKAVLGRMDARDERDREIALIGRRGSLAFPDPQVFPQQTPLSSISFVLYEVSLTHTRYCPPKQNGGTIGALSRGPRSVKSYTSKTSKHSKTCESLSLRFCVLCIFEAVFGLCTCARISQFVLPASASKPSVKIPELNLQREIETLQSPPAYTIGISESFAGLSGGVEPDLADPMSRFLEDQVLQLRIQETNSALAELERELGDSNESVETVPPISPLLLNMDGQPVEEERLSFDGGIRSVFLPILAADIPGTPHGVDRD